MSQQLPLSEAARVLGVSKQAIHQRIRRGTLEGQQVDGKWYVSLPDVDASVDTDRQRVGDELDRLRHENEVLRAQVDTLTGIIRGAMIDAQQLRQESEPKALTHEAGQAATTAPWWRRMWGSKG